MNRLLAALPLALALSSLPPPAGAADPEVEQLLQRAQFWESRARDDLALEELERALRLAPDDADALLAFGRLQLKANQEREAASTLERLRRVHPSHPGVAQLTTLLRVSGPDRDRLRQARQLAAAGREEEAVAAYRALFPQGMPDDELALEYAEVLGATQAGWEEARAMLAQLARKHTQDARYGLAFASHLALRKPVAAETLATLRDLSAHPSAAISRPAQSSWRRALIRADAVPENLPALREYLAANPGDTAVRDRLEQMIRDIAEARERPEVTARTREDGWSAFGTGRLEEAEARWREVLARDPKNAEAIGGIGLIRMRQDRLGEALEQFEQAAQLDRASRAKWEELASTARYWLLLRQAREARAAMRLDEARPLAEQARALDPKRPDAALELARIHLAAGRDRDAESLLGELSEESRRGVRRAIDAMRAERLRERARQAQAQGRVTDALAALEQAAALEPDDPWVRLDLARLQAGAGDPARGRAVFDELLRRRPADVEARYAYAIFLSGIGSDSEAMAVLEAIAPAERTDNMTRLQRRLWVGVQAGRAEGFAQRGDRAEAERILARAGEAAGGDRELMLTVARALSGIGADAMLRELLDRMGAMGAATPEQQAEEGSLARALSMRRARELRAAGRLEAAEEVYRELLGASPEDVDARLALAQMLIDRGAYDEARPLIEAARRQSPTDANVLGAAALIARSEGDLDAAIAHEQRALAGGGDAYRYRRLAQWLDDSLDWSFAAGDMLYRSGTPGKSRISAQDLSAAWKQGWSRGGRWFVRVAAARVATGTLDVADSYEVSTFGGMLLCQPLCEAPGSQEEKGFTAAAGFERGGWRFDVGTSPVGFPVVNVLGGVARDGDVGPLGYTLEVSRRALTSSALSYAGTRDPYTGRTWGGVVANGVRLNVSRDSGGDYGAWGLAGLYRLTGRNVLDNDKAEVMGGLYRRLVNEQDRLLTVGVAGMWWRFSENAGEFTFGHGGYYSPGDYRSLSLPVGYAFRSALTSVALRASVSVAWSESRAAPFYPTDPELQREAEALAPTSFVDPNYAGGKNGHSYGRSFAVVAERQLAPGVFVGGRLQVERSTNYTPNRFLLYVRFALDGAAARPVALPPEPGLPGFGY